MKKITRTFLYILLIIGMMSPMGKAIHAQDPIEHVFDLTTGSSSVDIYKGTNPETIRIDHNCLVFDNIPETDEIVFTGTAIQENKNIIIHDSVSINVTFDNLIIDNSQIDWAFGMNPKQYSTINLTLKGENKLLSGSRTLAFLFGNGGTLNITEESTGSLEIRSGELSWLSSYPILNIEGGNISGNEISAMSTTVTGGSLNVNRLYYPVINGGVTVANTTYGSPIVSGGSANISTSMNVTDENGTSVYLKELTIGTGISDINIDDVTVDGVSYPVNDVKTDADGKIYLWLPTNDTDEAIITATTEDGTYGNVWAREDGYEDIILHPKRTIQYLDQMGNDITDSLPTEYDSIKEFFYGMAIDIPFISPYDNGEYAFDGWSVNGDPIQNIAIDSLEDSFILESNWTDIVAPTGRIIVSKKEFTNVNERPSINHFIKNKTYITIEGSDLGSGVQSIEYIKSNKPLSLVELKNSSDWKAYTESLTFEGNDKFYMYARISDAENNTVIMNSEGVVLYTDSKSITTQLSYKQKSLTPLDIKLQLNENSLNTLALNSKVLEINKDYTLDLDNETITLKADVLETLGLGNHVIEVSYLPLGESFIEDADNEAPLSSHIILNVLPNNDTSIDPQKPDGNTDSKDTEKETDTDNSNTQTSETSTSKNEQTKENSTLPATGMDSTILYIGVLLLIAGYFVVIRKRKV